jgi:rod shape-determining protein MreD
VNIDRLSPNQRYLLNIAIIVGSLLLCLLLQFMRLPGMSLLGNPVNWATLWTIVWSINHPLWSSTIAGIAVGMIQDGLTDRFPSHIPTLTTIAVLTSLFYQRRGTRDGRVIVALLIAFFMLALGDTITAFQYALDRVSPELHLVFSPSTHYIWQSYKQIVLSSLLLGSLWFPVLYYPLTTWWQRLHSLERSDKQRRSGTTRINY